MSKNETDYIFCSQIKNQKIFFGIAVVVFIIGIVSFFINGFNVDIDFVGGTEISYDINKTVTKEDTDYPGRSIWEK